MNTNERFEWFQTAVSTVAKTNQDGIQAWSWAQCHALRPGWQEWVEDCVSSAAGPKVRNSMGALIAKLKGTRPVDRKPEPERVVGQCEWDDDKRAEARQLSLNAPPSRPPLAFVLPLSKRLGSHTAAVQFLTEEWERQGKPSVQDFNPSCLGLEAI